MTAADDRLHKIHEEQSVEIVRRHETDVEKQVRRDQVYQQKHFIEEDSKQEILKRLNRKFKNAEIQQLLNIYWIRQKREESQRRAEMRAELKEQIHGQNRLNKEMQKERQMEDSMRYQHWKYEKKG